MLDKIILGIKNNSVYQELNAYYGQSTVFSALGIERNENRHSAFISWLLNPKSDHQLGVEPLKKFLALYASAGENVDAQLRAALITGRFDIENVQIENEVALSRFSGEESIIKLDKKQKRLDVWAEIAISLPDSTSCKTIALVIENKIYSKEGGKDGDYQTEVYHNCLSQYYCEQILFEVFLTPDAEQAIVRISFT